MRRALAIIGGAAGFVLAGWAQTPTITAVQDAASYTSTIAQGSVFVVKGNNLSASGFVQFAPASGQALAYPTTLNNVSISVGGTPAYMVYTYNQNGLNQLAAILPSTVPTGSANLTVTNNGATSAAFKVNVVTRKFEIISADSSGGGQVVVQNVVTATQYDVNRFTTGTLNGFTYSPAHPGQTLIVYGTGMGPISGADNTAPGAVDLRGQVQVQVIVGGEVINPAYAGRAPSLPGADQINFTLPSDVATGCTVPFQVSVGGVLSNATTISIAPVGATSCPVPGLLSSLFTPAALGRLDQGGDLVSGSFAVSQFTTLYDPHIPFVNPLQAQIEQVVGAFGKTSGLELAAVLQFLNPSAGCQVFHRIGDQNALLLGPAPTNLDAGAITVTGPNFSNKSLTKAADNSYSLALPIVIPANALPSVPPGFTTTPSITAGTYTLTGTGGADVGSFTAQVSMSNPLKLSAPIPATINRNNSLQLSWTGGNSTDLVQVIGFSGSTVGGTKADPVYDASTFVCTTTAGQGGITIPASILQQMQVTPPDALTAGTGLGALVVLSTLLPSATNGEFTAPLLKENRNIDLGIFAGTFGTLGTPLYQ